ncbi:hypothetical protein JCM17844_21970 [Iodidimonas gelatinilytica]|uniref:Uncharacterized protein n=1 Tax=Iodidimonas gelatinilytica TaxID=1236966 RepID=A0A5A7N3U9_9PROT|nr:tetratricopeptide repeat protein [Iodidimonas gelatinilytica]GEQ98560.1 hypothetical protein JCM17844_21970 [Iodidimonas gelatinilytica]GER01759.1 hypothetical protein JCM17845_23820 [Iodidimonas gelatinilytica]
MRYYSCALAAISLAFTGATALAQTTGSRIVRNNDQPVNIIRFEEPAEITQIRILLNDGKTDKAILAAENLLEKDKTPLVQYAAWNALCVIHSTVDAWNKALAACDKAIKIRPNHWMALNSRGTLHLMRGTPQKAITDYRAALANLPEKSHEADVVRHNIDLAEAQAGFGS